MEHTDFHRSICGHSARGTREGVANQCSIHGARVFQFYALAGRAI